MRPYFVTCLIYVSLATWVLLSICIIYSNINATLRRCNLSLQFKIWAYLSYNLKIILLHNINNCTAEAGSPDKW